MKTKPTTPTSPTHSSRRLPAPKPLKRTQLASVTGGYAGRSVYSGND